MSSFKAVHRKGTLGESARRLVCVVTSGQLRRRMNADRYCPSRPTEAPRSVAVGVDWKWTGQESNLTRAHRPAAGPGFSG